MFKRIDHVALHVADVPAAVQYYVETFGFEKIFEQAGTGGHTIAYVRLGDSMIEMTTRPGGEPMSGFHLCLQPKDFDRAIEDLTAKGLPLVTAPRPTTPRGPLEAGWRRAVFQGRHGELIEIRG
ncbi:MAG TPA: VOC family protein [Alphaproteobacteria bacterium]|jgi:catechol 2,3-dioxygenase-like lactoylglutathione lyase family enzyme|nr:VOC family protein [Alphaproteobacteria bacterium]